MVHKQRRQWCQGPRRLETIFNSRSLSHYDFFTEIDQTTSNVALVNKMIFMISSVIFTIWEHYTSVRKKECIYVYICLICNHKTSQSWIQAVVATAAEISHPNHNHWQQMNAELQASAPGWLPDFQFTASSSRKHWDAQPEYYYSAVNKQIYYAESECTSDFCYCSANIL